MALAKLDVAQEQYDATPAGMADLAAEVSRLTEKVRTSPELRRPLIDAEARLDQAQRRRAQQKAALVHFDAEMAARRAERTGTPRDAEAALAQAEQARVRVYDIARGAIAPTSDDLTEAPRRPFSRRSLVAV